MMIEIKGLTVSSEDFDSQIKDVRLLPVSSGVAIHHPETFDDAWVSQVNRLLRFYALDLAAYSYGRTLIFSHKTSFLQEPDSSGFVYAYSSRGETVELNAQLLKSENIPDHIRQRIRPLVLQTFRHDHVGTFLQDNCSYVPTAPAFQSHPFAPLIADSATLGKLTASTQPIRVTYPHRMLLDSFGSYRTHEGRVFAEKLELALALGFRANAAQSEVFFAELELMVSPDGDTEKLTALLQFLRSFAEKNMDSKLEQQLSLAHMKLPALFKDRPHGRFGTIGAVTGLVQDNVEAKELISTRYSIAHRGQHLALVDVIPTLPKKPVNVFAQQLAGSPARYQYLIINSGNLGRKVFPDIPLVGLHKDLPIGIAQYLPETKAFAMLDQKQRLHRKRHLLGGFFINPIDDQLVYSQRDTPQIIAEMQRAAGSNPIEMLSPELFSVDHNYRVNAALSEELIDALKFFRDRNALHEAYSVKTKAPSLPGAQAKMPVALELIDQKIVIKPSDSFEDQRFTHILKLPVDVNNNTDDKEKAGLCALEFLGMFTASKLGLEVPRFGVVSWPSLIKELDMAIPEGDLSREPAYLIERFDITADPDKSYILREFQALMGEVDKFKTIQGMPHSAESVCVALKKYSTDFDSDKYKLLRFLVVNDVIGNTDMHLKNIAMLEVRDDEKNIVSCRLSPAYDIACVDALNPTFFLNSNDLMHAKGLTYNGKVRPTVSDWVRIAETCLGIDGPKCLAVIDDIADRGAQFVRMHGERHVSDIFSKSALLRDQYQRAMRRLSLGVKLLKDRGASRDGYNVPYDEFRQVWNKTYEEAQRDDARTKVQQNAVKQGGETINRSVNVGDDILAALLLPETSGRNLDGKTYQPGGTEQVMISDAIRTSGVAESQDGGFPDINDLPDFLRG